MCNPDKDTSISLPSLLCDEETTFLFREDVNENIGIHSLNTLTAFDYLHHFACMFCPESPPESVVSEAEKHVLAVARDVNLMHHRSSPYIIAVAAILMETFGDELTKEAMDHHIRAISSCENEIREHMFSYYKLMQEKVLEKQRENIDAPASSLTSQWSNTSVVGYYSSVTSSKIGKQCTFEDKENCPP
ncbi:hypothetical protein RIF29_31692 [Crotalaria pallida]|uniref:Cyclin C-terminal domain-containing protein n=1 Tax=Crotalaria pallida TaxID=3830 RepID=A0AAN9EI17_CROPI